MRPPGTAVGPTRQPEDSPCTGCIHRARCYKEKLACDKLAFNIEYGGATPKRVLGMKPSRVFYRQVFGES